MGCFVLQNKNKQTVRSFQWQNPTLIMVYRQDTHRVEAVNSVDELEALEIPHHVLLVTTKDEVKKRAQNVAGLGTIRYQEESGAIAPSFDLAKDEEHLKDSLKYSSMAHVGLLGVLLILSFVSNYFFPDEKPTPVVIHLKPIQMPVEVPMKKVVTVKPTEKKIEPIKKMQKISNVTKDVPVHPKKVTVVKKVKIRKDIPVNVKAPDINQMGALSALKAVRSKGSAMSLNLNGVGTSEGGKGSGGRGYGGNGRGGGGLGEGLKGGASGALPGKGLIASSPGTGSQASGAGGYGSSGSGGGRNSEGGAISFRGKSGGFMVPIKDEATVEAGLGRDQIDAIVQKNMGQIIYCYEMGLQGKPDLKGRLTASWVINGSGRVNMASVAHSSLSDGQVEDCISQKIKGWKFPRPVGGVNVDVSYPFDLRRVSQL